MDNKIVVSIIVPCYNCGETIEKCVESIRNQTYSNIEIILVDDGSKDDTPTKCDEYEAKDKRIIVIHQENRGLVRAWKVGVRTATGEYIAFCDSDDYMDCDLMEKTIRKAVETKAEIISFGAIAEYSDGSSLKLVNRLEQGLYTGDNYDEIKGKLLFTGKMQSQQLLNSRWSKLFARELLLRCLDDISDNLTNGEDAVTTYDAVLKSNSLYNISGFYPYHYLRNDQSMIGGYDSKWYDKMVVLREELLKVSELNDRNDNNQIENFFFSNVIMFVKKEMGRDSRKCQNVVEDMLVVRNDIIIQKAVKIIDISKYTVVSKLFASLFIKKQMTLLYYLTKLATFLGLGKQ